MLSQWGFITTLDCSIYLTTNTIFKNRLVSLDGRHEKEERRTGTPTEGT